MTPSHILKLQRAEKHLEDLKSLVGPIGDRRPYPVIETHRTECKKPRWVYCLDLDAIEPDETFGLIYGDFLFNVRSALDHLMVALVPKKHKSRAQFPIFTNDPLATNDTNGCYLNADAASKWCLWTRGLPRDCVAALQALQPYDPAGGLTKPSELHAVAVLGALQNADKHRNLVEPLVALREPQITTDGIAEDLPSHRLKNRAVLESSHRQMQVEIEGSAFVGVESAKRRRLRPGRRAFAAVHRGAGAPAPRTVSARLRWASIHRVLRGTSACHPALSLYREGTYV